MTPDAYEVTVEDSVIGSGSLNAEVSGATVNQTVLNAIALHGNILDPLVSDVSVSVFTNGGGRGARRGRGRARAVAPAALASDDKRAGADAGEQAERAPPRDDLERETFEIVGEPAIMVFDVVSIMVLLRKWCGGGPGTPPRRPQSGWIGG